MTGTVVTFYSYKGGVGRTFALANTAAVLARWGYRTLCIDWDLDAPGLAYYFGPWLPGPPTSGLVDLIDDLDRGHDPDPLDRVLPVALPGATARLDLLPAGAGDEGYVRRSQDMDWAGLYERRDLGGFLERCRERWKATYDVVLVDSRTGITDIGGICTAQLPDVLVMLFTANEQSLTGTLDVARRARVAHNALPYDRAGLMVVPVPSRFDGREEYQRATQWQARFARDLAPLVDSWASRDVPFERLLGHLTIPYVSYWSFGEDLPAVVESDPTPERIGYSLETLAALVAHRLDRTELLAGNRDSYVGAAARAGLRRDGAAGYDVFLTSSGADQAMVSRLAAALADRSLRVFEAGRDVSAGQEWSRQVQDAIARSNALVVLVGPDGPPGQEIEWFLRQTFDDAAGRPVVPVALPGARGKVPRILGQFQPALLPDRSAESLRAVAAEIDRIVSRSMVARGADPGAEYSGASPSVFTDTADVLTSVRDWRLDSLRWQLVAQHLDAMEAAVVERDEAVLGDVTAELELLGPVRSSNRSSAPQAEIPESLRARVSGLIERLDG
jgi:MinD-like ATPase involved in chromosome partitioning or flagellar assembly